VKEWEYTAQSVTFKSIGSTVKELSEMLLQGTNQSPQITPKTAIIPPAGKEHSNEFPESVLYLIFSHLPLTDCLQISSVCSAWKKVLDNPEFYSDRTFAVTNRMFIKMAEQTPVNKNSDYSIFVKFQTEVIHFLQTRGQLIKKFILRTPDAKEATIFMRFISSRITHLTFSFTEIVEPLFADNQFWVEVLESATLIYLNFQETKLSKMQVPVQIRDKVKEISYPPFIYNAYACYDYNHSDPNSREFFSFKAGDKFQILPSVRDLQGWKIAVNEQGEKGFVPGNYLVMLDKK